MVDTDLATALILLFDGREADEIGAAIAKASGDRMWKINEAIDRANHCVSMYAQDVHSIREKIREEFEDDQVLAAHVTDEMIFAELQLCELPDGVYDAMHDAWYDLFQEWKKKGWIVDAPQISTA